MSENDCCLTAEVEQVTHLGGRRRTGRDFPPLAIQTSGSDRGRAAGESAVRHHTEDGGAGADAESDDQNGEGGEPRIPAEGPKGVAKSWRASPIHCEIQAVRDWLDRSTSLILLLPAAVTRSAAPPAGHPSARRAGR